MGDSDFKLSKLTNIESEDGDNVYNVHDVVVDQAAEDGAGNQCLPDTIPSNILGIRRFQGRK